MNSNKLRPTIIQVTGPGQTNGATIHPHGSKNAGFALITGGTLFPKITLKNIPNLADIEILVEVLEICGSKVEWDRAQHTICFDHTNLNFGELNSHTLPGDIRGTSLFFGPAMGRAAKYGGTPRVNFQGDLTGCQMGDRLLNAHYDVLKKLAVEVEQYDGGVRLDGRRAKSGDILLGERSVTATENAIMLAVMLKGETRIFNAASEPHVQVLCQMLNQGGASVEGIGTDTLRIVGGYDLQPIEFENIPDQCQAVTFLAIAAATGGSIRVANAMRQYFDPIEYWFNRFNIHVDWEKDTAVIRAGQQIALPRGSRWIEVQCNPYPGLPVDLLDLFIIFGALLNKNNEVLVHKWMYENGLEWALQLRSMGINVELKTGRELLVRGGNQITPSVLAGTDIIRPIAVFIACAVLAKGASVITKADYLSRGYERFIPELAKAGLDVVDVTEEYLKDSN
jgi:UDP-N-acetylglucosamine 1-carboxyvinyltransferase